MARIRTIKPEFWQDEKLASLDPLTRLVFLGIISMADDGGRLVDNVKMIDGTLFPETDDSSRGSIEILARLGRVLRYRSESGQKLLQVVHWERHQKVDNPNKYVLPAPAPQDPTPQTDVESSLDPRETVARPSRDPLVTTNDQRPTTNDQRSRRSPKKKHSTEPELSALFLEAKAVYPKRVNNNWSDAWKAWQARMKQGDPEEVMLAGTRAYRALIDHMRTDPQYVKQAATFYGPSRHYLNDFTIGPPSPNGQAQPIGDEPGQGFYLDPEEPAGAAHVRH